LNLILGAGLAGLSCAYHLGHEKCLLLEKNEHPFGRIHSTTREGFTWDEGPHVSFTKSEYVRDLFARSVGGEFEEYPVLVRNFYRGTWIDHPAQSNLFQVPEPLRTECLRSFYESREAEHCGEIPPHYGEWLTRAFGEVFAETFPFAYTKKYWTLPPEEMTTDWVGNRVFLPSAEDVENGSKRALPASTHYISQVRYPSGGGYQSFAKLLAKDANIHLNTEIARIDLKAKKVWTADGRSYAYSKLINTLPLPVFVRMCDSVPARVLEAAYQLLCTQLAVVNITAPHPSKIKGHWFYVYDEDKLSTRINITEHLASGNSPEGSTGIQVEVYYSKHRPLPINREDLGKKVFDELCQMGFLDADAQVGQTGFSVHTVDVPWANVVCNHLRRESIDVILSWLSEFGLEREVDDLDPMTHWATANDRHRKLGSVILAGRFSQWKYYWTDDCVLRGKAVATWLNARPSPKKQIERNSR